MQLKKLLLDIARVDQDVDILGLALNSDEVKAGYVFFALAGIHQHGLAYAEQAIGKGAVAILYEAGYKPKPELSTACVWVEVEELGKRVGEIAARFYGHPTRKLTVVGITGTNGKTSCSQFLAQILPACGLIGTLGWGMPGDLHETRNTTPDAVSVQAMIHGFLQRQFKTVVMEVSSHGLQQGRVHGVDFKGAVLTNISRDHLDYHGTLQAYVRTKLTLLERNSLEFVVVNLDEPYTEQALARIKPDVLIWAFSCTGKRFNRGRYVLASNVNYQLDGTSFDVIYQGRQTRIDVPVFGEFNLANIMTVLTTALALGMQLGEITEKLRTLKPVPGRMQGFATANRVRVWVDYAHTPDALEKALQGLRLHHKNRLWLVFGCGGNRDRGKRAQMGEIAQRWADHIILTNDNPRYEDAGTIIEDILSGIDDPKQVQIILDRKQAITSVMQQAESGDWILVAGKGHEDYQEIQGQKIPFSDVSLIERLLNGEAARECN